MLVMVVFFIAFRWIHLSTPLIRLFLLVLILLLRSEERFSRNAETDLVCRLLLEKKKKTRTTKIKGKALHGKACWEQHTGGYDLTSRCYRDSASKKGSR